MRTFAATLLGLLLVSRPSLADGIPTPEALYQQQKKSPALAVTLEALCPIAGAGALYAGEEGDKGAFLAILSAVSGGVGAGSVLWLIHLGHEHPTNASRVFVDAEQGAAISA